MKLYYSSTSPFSRKVILAAHILKLDQEIELIPTDVQQFNPIYSSQVNPLNKVPALVTRTGEILTNSPFICEYLNEISFNKKILPVSPDRWRILNHQSIADGLADSAVLLRQMSVLQQPPPPVFLNRHREKVTRSIMFLHDHLSELQTELNLAGLSWLCSLSYLDFRFPKEGWIDTYPRIRDWQKKFSSWDVFQKTQPK